MNPKPEIRILKPENPETEAWNPKSEAWNPKPGTRNPRNASQVHGGADIDFMIYKAKDGLDGETVALLTDIQANRHEWYVAHIRQSRYKTVKI